MGALKLRQKVNFPATVTAEGGLGIDKVSGVWTVSPKWENLVLVTSLSNPEAREIWARNPADGSYVRISVQALINSLPQGPSGQVAVGTTTTLPAGSNATVANSGTSTSAVLDFGLPAGADGSTVRNGSGVPSSGLGNNGDFYIDTSASKIYGPKAAGAWGSGTSLIGPQGPTGVQGTPTSGHQVSWFNSTTIQDNGAMPASGMVKSDGTKLVAATAGTDFVAATSGSAIQKANGSGGLAAATAGTDFMKPDTTSTVSKGFTLTPNSIGTISSGTVTPDPTLGNYQYYTNNGAHTLATPSSDCAIDILVTNGASAGSITFSGFTVASGNTGDALTTTSTNKFIVSIRRINGVSTYAIKALQ